MKIKIAWGVAIALLALAGILPGMVSAQNVRVLSTGISIDERVPNADYPLLIVFANAKGQLVANIDVVVKDKDGKTVVSTNSDGPWLFLGLAAGDYTITARMGKGPEKSMSFAVPASGQKRIWITF